MCDGKREMTREELLTEYLIQRNELNEVKKKYSKLVSYVCDFLYREIDIKKQKSYYDYYDYATNFENRKCD